MSAIEIALAKTARPADMPVSASPAVRLRTWLAAQTIDLADQIAARDKEMTSSGKDAAGTNPWARPIGLGR